MTMRRRKIRRRQIEGSDRRRRVSICYVDLYSFSRFLEESGHRHWVERLLGCLRVSVDAVIVADAAASAAAASVVSIGID